MKSARTSAAEVIHEYGPFPGADQVHGVTYDGRHVWFASGDRVNAFDPESGDGIPMSVAGRPPIRNRLYAN